MQVYFKCNFLGISFFLNDKLKIKDWLSSAQPQDDGKSGCLIVSQSETPEKFGGLCRKLPSTLVE